jgi:hypothetical protein
MMASMPAAPLHKLPIVLAADRYVCATEFLQG